MCIRDSDDGAHILRTDRVVCGNLIIEVRADIILCGLGIKAGHAGRLFPGIPSPQADEPLVGFGRDNAAVLQGARCADPVGHQGFDGFYSRVFIDVYKRQQQKVSICCALLSEPKVIMLDEPLVGLDPHAIKELKQMLLELRQRGCSILVSTHMLDSVEELWDKALIMVKGRIAAVRTRSEIEANGEDLEQLFFAITEGTPDGGTA